MEIVNGNTQRAMTSSIMEVRGALAVWRNKRIFKRYFSGSWQQTFLPGWRRGQQKLFVIRFCYVQFSHRSTHQQFTVVFHNRQIKVRLTFFVRCSRHRDPYLVTRLQYGLTPSPVSHMNFIKNNFIQMRFYFQSLTYSTVQRHTGYTWFSLLCE